MIGNITINKRLRDHPVWDRDPACYGRAWVDLIALANDAPRTTFIHGEPVCLNRGQLAWSQRALEKEWQRSGEWVSRFLKFCEEQTMITVETNKRRTVITIVNYDVYNPSVTVSETDTEPAAEPVSETDTEPAQKGETGIGIGKGEANPQQKHAFAEMPSEAEVLSFGLAYPGDLARGIPPQIPEAWTLGWFAFKSGGNFPKKWRENLVASFRADWVAGLPKARGGLNKKNAAASPSGRTPAQVRFELSRELEGIEERLDALHEVGAQPSKADEGRAKELKRLIRELPE